MSKLMTRLTAGLCLAALGGLSTQALAQTTVTLSPTADSYIQQGTPTTNYGTATTMLVRIDTANSLSRAGYLQFDLSTVPSGTITSAVLRVFGSHDPGGTGVTIGAFTGTNTATWSETALNWSNGFSLVGVDFNAPPVTTAAVSPTAQYYTWDVTSFINSRRTLGHATVALYPTAANTYRVTFNSREATANRPQLVVTVGGTTPPPSGNWPMFGHDYDNTRASGDTTISAGNVSTLHVVWRNGSPSQTGGDTIVGGVPGTPAIVDGIAYVCDFNGWVRAINATTGVEVWRRQLTPTGSTLRQNPGSVFVSADTVYVGGNIGMIYAVNRSTGALRWSRQIETTPNSRITSSPIVFDNKVIVGTGSYQVWISATPIFRGSVKFLDATTGALLPYTTSVCPSGTCGGGLTVWSTAAVDPTTRTGFIGTGQAYAAPAGPYSDALVAFNIDTGAIKWAGQFQANDVWHQGLDITGHDHDIGAAPNLFTATVNGVARAAVGVGNKGGLYRAYDRNTGALLWSHTLGPASPLGGMMYAAAYSNGVIYAVSNDLDSGAPGPNGRFPAPARARAINANTGALIWSTALTQGGYGGVSVANGLMYFTTWDGILHVLNTTTGAQVKTVQIGTAPASYVVSGSIDGFPNGSSSGPMVYNGRVYVGYGWTWVLNIPGGLASLGL